MNESLSKKIKKNLKKLASNVVFFFRSFFWHRDYSVVLLGSWFGEKFADNPRFLFQYLSDNKEKLRLTHVIWVTYSEEICKALNDMGYEAYITESNESIKWHKKAKYHILSNANDDDTSINVKSDILTKYSYGAIKINLWHGVIALKGVGKTSNAYHSLKEKFKCAIAIKEFLERFALFRKFFLYSGGWGDCYYLTTQPYENSVLRKFFNLPKKNYVQTGQPRNCLVVNCKLLPLEQEVINLIRKYQTIILYLPTFRCNRSSFDFEELAVKMKSYVESKGILWIQKFHSAGTKRNSLLKHEGNVVTLPHTFDINTIIPNISIMITDYSSAFGDAMFFYKPILFYVPDYDEYAKGDRGFSVKTEDVMCGDKVMDIEALKKCIDRFLYEGFLPDDKYLRVRKKYYGYYGSEGKIDIWKDLVEHCR